MDYTPPIQYHKPEVEIVRYHGSRDSESEGMTNKSSSCWMISVIQALRASSVFKEQFALDKNEQDPIKKELFHLFDILEGKNHQKKRTIKQRETDGFRALLRQAGLPVKERGGFSDQRFLRFLLKHLKQEPIIYYTGSRKGPRKHKEMLCELHASGTKLKTLNEVITQNRLSFAKKAPKFLPILLRHSDKTPIDPAPEIVIDKARYKLVSIAITRRSISHSYSYIPEKSGWVEYNNHRVIIHPNPETHKRRKDTLTPYEDACLNSKILIYEKM